VVERHRPDRSRRRAAVLAFGAAALLAVFAVGQVESDAPTAGQLFTILPESGSIIVRGPAGGPFEPAQGTFVLRNDGHTELSWDVSSSMPWLSFPGPTRGVVPAGGEVSVEFGIDPAVGSLTAGFNAAVARFQMSGPASFIATRRVLLQITEPSGWTTFTPSPDTRTIYVSPAGDDGFDGLSPAKAKRTIAAGIALLRHGYPDWLLLERGGVWHEALGHWVRSGRSAAERMVVGSYGSDPARPKLLTGLKHGIDTDGGGGSPPHIDCLALVGLEFVADQYSGATDQVGARMLQPGSHFLIEDCLFRGYGVNLVFQGFGGRHSDFSLRRSVIVDAYALHSVGHSQGLYAYAVDGLLIEDNVFDHNGWNESVPDAGADMFNHNLYIDNDNTGVVVRGNLIANASSHGMQLRPGGVCVDNLFVRNSIALSVGGGTKPDPGGVIGDVRQNVILDGKNIDADNPRGWALWFGNIVSGRVSDNVVANNVNGTSPVALALDGQVGVGIHDLVLENNVISDWGGNVVVEGDADELSGITLRGNEIQDRTHPHALVEHRASGTVAALTCSGNRFYSPRPADDGSWFVIARNGVSVAKWQQLSGDATSVFLPPAYPDPERGVASYSESLGGAGTTDDFIANARRQSKASWQPAFTAEAANAYIRAGFGH
jgi:hypothetical protein